MAIIFERTLFFSGSLENYVFALEKIYLRYRYILRSKVLKFPAQEHTKCNKMKHFYSLI